MGVQVSSAITEEEWEIENEDPELTPYVAIWKVCTHALEPRKVGWDASLKLESKRVTLRKTTVASELAQLAADKTIQTYEELVPEEY